MLLKADSNQRLLDFTSKNPKVPCEMTITLQLFLCLLKTQVNDLIKISKQHKNLSETILLSRIDSIFPGNSDGGPILEIQT